MAKRLESLRIPLEISLVKLAHDKRGARPNLTPTPPKEEQEPQPIKEKDATQIIREEESAQESSAQTPSTSLDAVKSAWNNIIDNLSRIKMSVATYLNEGSPTKLEKNVLTISFPVNYSLHKESLERKENKAIIEKALLELLNAHIKINFALSKEVAQKNNREADPFIKSALQTFNGKVIKDE
jgi:hypothetical protein